jgi:hypothetical protein
MSGTPDTTRASDAERERVAGQLREAVGRGQLSLAEVDERLRAAYAAVTRHDLALVTADLPAPAPAAVARRVPGPPDRRAGEWRAWAGAALLMLAIWAATSLAAGHALFFWPVFPIGAWALSLAGGALGLRSGCAVPPHRG